MPSMRIRSATFVLASLGLIIAGSVPVRAADVAAAGAESRAKRLAQSVTIYRDAFGVPLAFLTSEPNLTNPN